MAPPTLRDLWEAVPAWQRAAALFSIFALVVAIAFEPLLIYAFKPERKDPPWTASKPSDSSQNSTPKSPSGSTPRATK